MPDHVHLLWAGTAVQSDQNRAMAFFRRHLNALLRARGMVLQKQAWDVVLDEKARSRGALMSAIYYITANPVRKEVVVRTEDWPYSGSQVAGYPDLDWRQPDFARRLWTIYDLEIQRLERNR